MLKKKFHEISLGRTLFLAFLFTAVGILVLLDYHALSKDFENTMKLLRNVRLNSAMTGNRMVVHFEGNKIMVENMESGSLYSTLIVPTLNKINYDTTLGKNMIVFTGTGTERYNKKIHGGDLTLKSWFGFKRHIWVNCTGFVQEGQYPAE